MSVIACFRQPRSWKLPQDRRTLPRRSGVRISQGTPFLQVVQRAIGNNQPLLLRHTGRVMVGDQSPAPLLLYPHSGKARVVGPRDYPGRESLPSIFTEWREDEEYTAEWWWEWLCYALNVERFQMENIHGVMFLGVIDGEHRCRPAIGAEVGQEQAYH
jgi:hypothetical protein